MNMKRTSGFTLLEIIIVIIIIGVLASLALPRLFSTVEYSRSAEALSAIATIRSSMERCYLQNNGSYADCVPSDHSLDELDIEDPAGSPNAHFDYELYENGDYEYKVVAIRNTVEYTGNDNAASMVIVAQGGTALEKCGTDKYAAIGNDGEGWCNQNTTMP